MQAQTAFKPKATLFSQMKGHTTPHARRGTAFVKDLMWVWNEARGVVYINDWNPLCPATKTVAALMAMGLLDQEISVEGMGEALQTLQGQGVLAMVSDASADVLRQFAPRLTPTEFADLLATAGDLV